MARLITPHGQEFSISPRDPHEGFVTDDLEQLVGGGCKAFLLKSGEMLLVNSVASDTRAREGNDRATHLLRSAVDDPGGEVRGYALLMGEQDLELLPRSLQTQFLCDATNGEQTVLLLDNDDEVRSVLALGLERHNFRVLQAQTVPEVVRFSPTHPIHLLVADVSSLDPDALETLGAIKVGQPQAKVLLISGYDRSTVASLHPGLVHGHAFLQKPFSFVVLAKVISHMSMTTGSLPRDESGFYDSPGPEG